MENQKEKRIIDILIFIMFLNIFFCAVGFYQNRTSPPMLIGALLLLSITLYIYRHKKNPVQIKWKDLLPFWSIGGSYLVFGCIYFIPTYLVYGFIFIFQLPLFYRYVSIENNNYIISAFSKCAVFIFLVAVIGSFLLSPMKQSQYCGILDNPNHWGEWVVFTTIPTIYLYENANNSRVKKLLLILMGLEVTNIVLSASRTTALSFVAIMIIFVLYKLLNHSLNYKNVLISIFVLILVFSSSYLILKYITPQTAAFFSKETVEENIDLENVIENVENRYTKGINDESSFSSGRVEIWNTYLGEISFKGNEPDPLVIVRDNNISKQNAHNTFLQVSYEAGIIAGVAFIFINLRMLWKFLKQLLSKKINIVDIFAMSGFLIAIIYMMLSSEFAPYSSFALMIYWIFAIPKLIQSDILTKKGKI